jgi:hypothetical protein
MPVSDANISEIVVVLDKRWENDLAGALELLKKLGMEINNADDDTSVVEGCIESCHIEVLEKLECVDYVRKVFSYDANYPPGDPRDRDGM